MHRIYRRSHIHHWVVAGALGLLAACGGVTGTVSTSPGSQAGSGISTIDQLPLATSPVAAEASSSSLAKSFAKATTGINLSTLGSDTFDTDSSLAACEMSARFRHAFNAAAQGDRILCYIQNTFEANPDLGIDIYNGAPHVFDLTMINAAEGEDGGPSKIQMQITRGADGLTIADFVLHACMETTQTEFIHQTVTDSIFTMTSKNSSTQTDGQGSEAISVSGTLENGRFVGSKTIEGRFAWESTDGFNGHAGGTVTQTSDTIAYSGYESGTYSAGNGSGSFSHRIFSSAQLLDGNSGSATAYNLGLLAIGDGAAHVILSGSHSGPLGDFSWSDDVTQGWNGDTKIPDDVAAAAYLTVVNAGEVPAEGTASTVAFDGAGESFDCTTTGTPIEVDLAALRTACANLELGYEWVNCWEIIARDDQP